MKIKEKVFTCKDTEDLKGTCELCGKDISRHGSNYECLDTMTKKEKMYQRIEGRGYGLLAPDFND